MNSIQVLINGQEINRFALQETEDSARRVGVVPAAAITQDAGEIELALSFWDAAAGDDGEYVIPDLSSCFLTFFKSREDGVHTFVSRPLPILGCRKGGTAWLMVMEGMRYDYRIRVRIANGQYRISLVYDLDTVNLYEDVRFSLYTLTGKDANYVGIAHLYRRLQVEKRNMRLLKDRAENEPLIEEACGVMPIIRVRMGWKPVPSPVPEQTLETEPPMHVACTFKQVEELMDEMKAQGIEHAELCLVGWNVRGHDGRWPQAFPVEEALGGEEGMRAAIAHARRLGYRMVFHTNTSDAYRIADCWDEDDIIRTKSGKLHQNNEGWSGGNMYRLCPKTALAKHTEPTLARLEEMGSYGFHYIDVLGTVMPRNCFHPDHPATAEECARDWNTMFDLSRSHMGGSASEGGFDFTVGHLDYALYTCFHILKGQSVIADESIPLWQLVYHGYVLSNVSAETINTMVKAPAHRLKAYEYGAVPTVYYYSKFVGGNRSNWMGDDDMLCSTPEEMTDSVRRLKAELDAYAPYAAHQYATIENHRKLASGVYETTYSDGWRVYVNYNETDYHGEADVPAQQVVQVAP